MTKEDYIKLGIEATFNVDYIQEHIYEDNKDKLDIYIPQGSGPFPVLVFYHGGALMEGDKAYEQKAVIRFTKEKIAVVIANYRLSPGVMHPAHVQDAAAGVAWVKKNIADYGGDPNNIFVAGHSAGAYLAVLLSLDPQYLAVNHLTLSDIKGTIGVSPFLYVEETAKERDKSVWGKDEQIWKEASVSGYVGPDKPPMLLLYADGDDAWRKRHNEELAAALKDEGNQIEVKEISGRNHGSIWTDIDMLNDEVSRMMIKFIRENE